VVFPDGFRSAATIARVDRDWDLAALVIWRPQTRPIPLAAVPPRPGEPLAIAGYGKGRYRVDTGRCTQYLSPGKRHPFELVELTASARQGDSGGPIFNDRGELAGVLFGSASGRTTGSHSGRVRQFLAPLWDDFYRPSQPDTMIAASDRPRPPVASIQGRQPAVASRGADVTAVSVNHNSAATAASTVPESCATATPAARDAVARAIPGAAAPSSGGPLREDMPLSGGAIPCQDTDGGFHYPPMAGGVQPSEPRPGQGPAQSGLSPEVAAGSDPVKTILAAIGILALVFHGVRLLGRAVEV